MKSNNKNIEIEFRSLFDKKKHDGLISFLSRNGEDLGQDDKDVYFFIMPTRLLKVVDNISFNSAKIVLKLNKIGSGSNFKEIEIPIDRKEISRAVDFFKSLELTDNVMRSFQQRRNFNYKGVEIAVKYSDVWGYHAELEILIDSLEEKIAAENKINAIAKELNLKLMTDDELKKFTTRAEEKHKHSV